MATTAVALISCGPALAQSQSDVPPEPTFTVERFLVEGDSPLPVEEVQAVLEPFTGNHQGIAGLLAAGDALEQHLVKRGYAFHRVVLPPQTLEAGEVRLALVAFKLSGITINGNEYFSSENIRRSLPELKEGESPSTRQVARQRLLANRHPSKRVEVRFKESEEEAESLEAIVDVADSRPWSLFASLDNTGNRDSGHTRLTIGGQHSNLFDRDHSLTASYTRSPQEFDKIEQIGVNYSIPFYSLGGSLSAYFVDSDANTGQLGNPDGSFFDVSGAGRFWGAIYRHALMRRGGYTHGVSVGIDDKHFKNDISIVIGNARFPTAEFVRVRPLTLGYDGTLESDDGNVMSFYVRYSRNLPGGSNNTDYNHLNSPRAGADATWDVWRAGGSAVFGTDSGWTASARADLQWTDEPLVSGESFGIGGSRSVRGYEEREESGDAGFFLSTELLSPPIIDTARGAAFWEMGYRTRRDPQPGETKNNSLLGAGVGLRWSWRSNVSLQVDVARAFLDGSPSGTNRGDLKAHFTLFARY